MTHTRLRPVRFSSLASILDFGRLPPGAFDFAPLRQPPSARLISSASATTTLSRSFLDKYVLHLQTCQRQAHTIESVSFFSTPYILTGAQFQPAAQQSIAPSKPNSTISRIPKWSVVTVQIFLTDSYGPYTARSDRKRILTRSKGIFVSPVGFSWRDFRRPRFFRRIRWSFHQRGTGQGPVPLLKNSGCILSGATLTFEYPADAPSRKSSATIQIDPPEGRPHRRRLRSHLVLDRGVVPPARKSLNFLHRKRHRAPSIGCSIGNPAAPRLNQILCFKTRNTTSPDGPRHQSAISRGLCFKSFRLPKSSSP